MALEPIGQLGHPQALRGGREQHRRLPAVVAALALPELQRRPHRERGALRPLAVRLVDHEQVPDLHQPGLHGLDAVSRLRHQHHHRGVRGLGHLELALSHPDGLDQEAREAGRVEHVAYLRGVDRQPAGAAARRHRADVHALVAGQLAHADAVSEQRPTAERTGRVHRHDPHPVAAPAVLLREPGGERALPRAGGPGDPEPPRSAALLEACIEQRRGARGLVLDPRDSARQRDSLTLQDPANQLGCGRGVPHGTGGKSRSASGPRRSRVEATAWANRRI